MCMKLEMLLIDCFQKGSEGAGRSRFDLNQAKLFYPKG